MKIFKELLLGFVVVAVLIGGYTHLPMEWRRKKDIDMGNTLIQNIESYQKQHQKLPENGDEQVLQQLGFHHNKQGWQPNYRQLAGQQFQIVYADGYEAPFLSWDSRSRTWQLQQQAYVDGNNHGK